jgi:hypothetical protein
MPRITVSQSVAAGATFDAFATSQYRYLPWPGRIRILGWTTAVGVLFQALSGSETIQPETPVDLGAAAVGHLPTVFEVDPLDFAAPAGDLIQLNFRNTTAGALNVMAVIDVNPR